MSIRIRHAAASDAPGIRLLFERTFGTPLSEDEWAWKFERNPDGWFGTVAEDAEGIVGNYCGWGLRFRVAGRDALVYAVGDVATDPRARGLGRHVFQDMKDAFYEDVDGRGVPFCFGFPGTRHLTISNRLVGTRTLFPIREVRVPVGALPAPQSTWEGGDFVGEEFDALWAAAAPGVAFGPVRDRARVNWRFHARPDRYYRMVWTRGGHGWSGWAALSVSGRRALVVDFVLGPGEASAPQSQVFAAAAAEAGRLGAEEIVFWETPGGPGGNAIAALPGDRAEAGFSVAARPFDDDALTRFTREGHFVPSLYDVA